VCALFAALISAFASAQPACAQHIRGRLVDVHTGMPIPVGILRLLRADSAAIATVVSDAEGNWRLEVPRAGVYRVAAERIGYESWVSAPVEVAEDAELNSVFHLRALAVALDPIEVRARALREYLDYSGFFERQHANFGHFVGPEDIDKRQASKITDLLLGIPGVQRVYVSGGSVGPTQVQLRGSSVSQGGVCRPRVYLDGLMYARGDSRPIRPGEGDETDDVVEDLHERMDQGLSIDDIGHPSIIAGVEVYRSASQVPVQFGGGSVETLCGVIVIWTRTGRMRTGGA
jgi:hypothetical protein